MSATSIITIRRSHRIALRPCGHTASYVRWLSMDGLMIARSGESDTSAPQFRPWKPIRRSPGHCDGREWSRLANGLQEQWYGPEASQSLLQNQNRVRAQRFTSESLSRSSLVRWYRPVGPTPSSAVILRSAPPHRRRICHGEVHATVTSRAVVMPFVEWCQ
jgi:hypothetical protein